MIDKFDVEYEAKRRPGDKSEPGDSKYAPYRKQHLFAEKIEHMVMSEMGVDWRQYTKELEDK